MKSDSSFLPAMWFCANTRVDLSSSRAHTALSLPLAPALQSVHSWHLDKQSPAATALLLLLYSHHSQPLHTPQDSPVPMADCLCSCLQRYTHAYIYLLSSQTSTPACQLIWLILAIHHTLACTPTLTPVTAAQTCKANKKSNTCMKIFVYAVYNIVYFCYVKIVKTKLWKG